MSFARTGFSRRRWRLAEARCRLGFAALLALAFVGVGLVPASSTAGVPRVFLCRTVVDGSCSCVPDEANDTFIVHGMEPGSSPVDVDVCLRVGATVSNPAISSCDPASAAAGDEICAFQVTLAPYGDMSLSSFSASKSLLGVGGLIGAGGELAVNWVDTMDPRSAGEKIHLGSVDLTIVSSGGLTVSSGSQVVDADFSPAPLSVSTATLMVPEPSPAWSLFAGLLFLAGVAGRRRTLAASACLGLALSADAASAGLLVEKATMLDLSALAHSSGEAGDRELAAIGDVNGDGIEDLAIGIPTACSGTGAVVIAMMRVDGTVQRTFRLTGSCAPLNGTISIPLNQNSGFGDAVTSLGNLGGGTFIDRTVLAVAAPGDGRVFLIVLRPKSDGSGVTVEAELTVPLSSPAVVRAMVNMGDLDGNGVPDLALGQPDASSSNCSVSLCGIVGIAFMASDGSVVSEGKLESGVGGMPFLTSQEKFGFALALAGDASGDGVLAVGTPGYMGGAGGFLLLEVNTSGSSVSEATRFDQTSLSLPSWGFASGLGASIATIPDNASGLAAGLAVGAPKATGSAGIVGAGAIAVVVKDPVSGFSLLQAIDEVSGEIPQAYGTGVATMLGQSIALVDLAGDGLPEVFVDAAKDPGGATSGSYRASVVDDDDDGIPNLVDSCPAIRDTSGQDSDGDGVGDLCDNCPTVSNPSQADANLDGVGDSCEPVRVRLSAVGTASSPEWRVEVDCGASDVTQLQLALVPHRSANTTGWLRSLDFGGGCQPPPIPGGLPTVGCVASPDLGDTIDPGASGAFVTNANGYQPGYSTLRPDTLYVSLQGGGGSRTSSELCLSSDPTPTFLGTVTSDPAAQGEVTSLFLSLDLGFGTSPVMGSGPLALPSTGGIPVFESITVVSTGANRAAAGGGSGAGNSGGGQ